LSPCSLLLPCDQVSSCALAAFCWKRSHSHGLACNQVSPCALAASLRQCLHPRGLSLQLCVALCSCGVPPAMLALSRATLNQQPSSHCCRAAIVVGLSSLSGRHCHRAAIVVRLPLLSDRHCCWAAIVVGLPLLSGYHCCPIPWGYLRMAYLSLGYIVTLFSWTALKCPVCPCHWAVFVALSLLV
jgi:hypothetical protein